MVLPKAFYFKVHKTKPTNKAILTMFFNNEASTQIKITNDSADVAFVFETPEDGNFKLAGMNYFGTEEKVEVLPGKPLQLEVTLTTMVLDEPPLLPPEFNRYVFTGYHLICQTCQALLATTHVDYTVELEDAQEVMETAMGCCRCCSRGDNRCGHLADPNKAKILMDGCITLLPDDYFMPNRVKFEGNKARCTNCDGVFGRRRISRFIEVDPICADYPDDTYIYESIFGGWDRYFALRLNPDNTSYVTICNYDNEERFVVGFFKRQFQYLPDRNTRASFGQKENVLSLMYSSDRELATKNMGSKVYFSDKSISRLIDILILHEKAIGKFDKEVGKWRPTFLRITREVFYPN